MLKLEFTEGDYNFYKSMKPKKVELLNKFST